MPLESIKKINDASSWALWRITEEIGNFFLVLDLKKEDMGSYDSISNYYKKLEWLASRVAAKYLLEHAGVDYQGISKDKYGKPHLVNQKGAISVSHSYPYVAVIYHQQQDVGIDLERPRERILKISKKFLNENELAYAAEDTRKITLLWSAKETLYKLHGRKFVIFKENLEVEAFELNSEGFLTGIIKLNGKESFYKIKYENRNDYLVSYTVR